MLFPALLVSLILAAPPQKTVVTRPLKDEPTDVLGRESFQDRAAQDLAELLSHEPGLQIHRLGGLGSAATLSIRGSTPEQVVISLDGFVLTPADGAPVDLGTLPLGFLSHLELHRGRIPYALGVSNLGGALQLQSRHSHHLEAENTLHFASFETLGLTSYLGYGDGTHSVSLGLDLIQSEGNFPYLHDGGTAWDPTDDHERHRTNNQLRQANVFLKSSARLTPHTQLDLLNLYTRRSQGLPGLGLLPTRDSQLDLERNLFAIALHGQHRLHWRSELSYHHAWSDVRDPLGELGPPQPGTRLHTQVPWAKLHLAYPILLHNLHLEPRLHAGFRWEQADTHDAQPVTSLSGEMALAWHQLHLTVGLKGELTPTHPLLGAFIDTKLKWPTLHLGLSAHLKPRLPSLFERYGNQGHVLGNPLLRPEQARSLEWLTRWQIHPTLHLNLFAYATWAEDLIQHVQNAQGITRFDNLTQARLLGAEAQLRFHYENFELKSSLSLLDATDTGPIQARHGKQLPMRPHLSTSHRLLYTFPALNIGNLSGDLGLYLELDHLAGNVLDYANLVRLPSRSLLGAGAFFRTPDFSLTLSLHNLLDARVQDLTGYPLPGFSMSLSLQHQFDAL